MTIKNIFSLFDIKGKYIECSEIVSGNINSTYKVTYNKDGEEKLYILQRINKKVFKSPEKVMDNIVKITNHVKGKVKARGESTRIRALKVYFSKDKNEPFVIDDVGDYWRCYRYIKNSITYDACDDLKVIEKMGSAFGRFQNDLSDFPAESLFVTIPNFHNTKVRYQAFKEAIALDPLKRTEKIKSEIKALLAFEKDACFLQDCLDDGKIPYRVTHNDTKCNNVAFDKDTGEALAVLDLDTVMSGAIAHDFGDAIRFIANTLKEDDHNFEKVALDMDKYSAFAKGFLSQVNSALSDMEKKTLNLGVFAMTAELSIRFMTDYILGDTYFKTKYPGHNLDRARNQLALAKDIKNKLEQMDNVIKNYI